MIHECCANNGDQLIAGRLSSNTQQTGEILVNGRKETLAFGTSVWKNGGL
jgi:hypothetical protein